MDTVDFLINAKAVISTPEKWTKGALAKDANGEEVSEHGEAAVCFCSLGALGSLLGKALTEPAWTRRLVTYERAKDVLREAVEEARGTRSVICFNDDELTTHADVMQVWDRAIELAKG